MPSGTNTDHRIGKDCKAYRNTGTNATPVWVEMDRIRDIGVQQTKAKADTSRRGETTKSKGAGQKERPITLTYVYQPGGDGTDADFDVLEDSFENDSTFEMAIMDGNIATSGVVGLRIFVEVFDFGFDQNIDDTMLFNVGLDHVAVIEAGSKIDPSWYEVA